MRFHVIAVGRAKSGPELALFEHYAARLSSPLLLREIEEKRPLPTAERRDREAALLLDAVPDGAICLGLDERGSQVDSESFADLLRRWRDEGARDIAFLIGGADGHGQAVRGRAQKIIAFGPMTWPHMLVRALLIEQLYRAECILAGHPYHRGSTPK